MIVYGHVSCICLHGNEGLELKKKRIPSIMRISIFGAFSVGKKCASYTGKYGSRLIDVDDWQLTETFFAT